MVPKSTALIPLLLLAGCGGMLFGQVNEKRTLSETSHQIYHASYSPDGKYIATTGSDNRIILWNSESGGVYRTLVGSKKRPNSVVFSSDGGVLFSAGEDGSINAWDIFQVQISNTTQEHSGAIKALDINTEGTLLASGGEDGILRVWGISGDRLTPVYELKGHRNTILTVAFDPDGRTLISGGADRTIMKWDVRTGTRTGEIRGAHSGWIRCATFSPDGHFIASGGDDQLVIIRNAADLSTYKTLKGHTDWVQTIDFTRSGDLLVSGGHDQYIRVWDWRSETEVGQSDKLGQIVLSVDASPMQNEFISSCLLSEQLRIWALAYGSQVSAVSTEAVLKEPAAQPADRETDRESDTGPVAGSPSIQLFSPEPVNGEVTHDRASILIIGKADDPDGIQTMLVNRQRVALSGSGIFQLDLELSHGENQVELVAVSNRGKMARDNFVIHCTDVNASAGPESTADQQGIYYALIIGVEDYLDEEIPDLDYPLADADSLHRTLINRYSFSEDHIEFLKNPERTDIIIAMDNLSRTVTEKDNLLIFYAGHGYWDEKTGIGYWLPNDADRENTANWFRNSTLRDFIGSIQSRHTLLIADACFSGSIFKTRSAFASEEKGIQKLHELPSRKAMTSGTKKEEVPDKSVFVKYLLRELNQNEARYLPSEELFGNFRTAVLNNSPNVPLYGTIQNVGDEGGDFIFVRK